MFGILGTVQMKHSNAKPHLLRLLRLILVSWQIQITTDVTNLSTYFLSVGQKF